MIVCVLPLPVIVTFCVIWGKALVREIVPSTSKVIESYIPPAVALA